MQTLTAQIIQAGWAGRVLTHDQLSRLLEGTPQRRYNLINRALRQGELLRLRRGLYLLSAQGQYKPLHPFVLAQGLQSGSYISLETALSFHGWIPEAVPLTLSVSPGRRQVEMDIPSLGLFRFYPLALREGYFFQSVERHIFSNQTALVAHPLRALMDLVCLRKLAAKNINEFVHSMRIDANLLREIPAATWQALRQVYTHKRMHDNIHLLQTGMAP